MAKIIKKKTIWIRTTDCGLKEGLVALRFKWQLEQFCLCPGFFNVNIFTADELREIAKELDKLNKDIDRF